MKQKAVIVSLLLLLVTGFTAQATHLMGGEITWTCMGNGNYVFQMKVYRDCATPVPIDNNGPISLSVFNHPSVSSIPMSIISQIDITPQCNPSGPTYNCSSPNGNTAVEEFILESAPVNLPGVPPAQGWIFTWTNCCRNAAITNLVLTFNGPGDPSNGFTLRAKMFPYNGQDGSPCFDSSPVFQERPNIIICAGTPFTYNPNAYDPDLDSLSYEFERPLNYLQGNFTASNPTAIPFEVGYNINSPFPDVTQNPNNVPVSLNPITGEMSFTSFTIGNFVEVIKVTAYKCGQPVAEIYREIQTVILSCGANFPPIVTAPFQNPTTALYSNYVDTVTAGDLVTFTITGSDNGFLPTGYAQKVTCTPIGGEFGPNCDHLPCATWDTVSAAGVLSLNFNWQTGCEHISNFEGCFNHGNVHTFTFTFKDDYCPAPSYTVVTATVVILPIPVIESPIMHCASVQANGDVLLTWETPLDTAGTFNSYHVFSSASPTGPFTELDSIFVYNQTTYTHSGASCDVAPRYYFVKSRSGCMGMVYAPAIDTLETIFVSTSAVVNNQFTVDWNPLHTPLLPSSFSTYRVYKQIDGGAWVLIATTGNISLVDSIVTCSAQYAYRVELEDTQGCISSSNVSIGAFVNNEVPADMELDSVSVVAASQLTTLGWQASADGDVVAYIIMQEINGVLTAIDTVQGRLNTAYTNANSNPDAGSEIYAIMAMDSCNNVGRNGNPHHTIFLAYIVNACKGEIKLDWSAYIGFGAVGTYRVYVKQDVQPYSLATTLSGTAQSYTFSNIVPSANYCFIVQAVSNVGNTTSTSNEICFQASAIQLSQYTYMNYATVIDDNTAELKCLIDTAADVFKYVVVRKNLWTGITDNLGVFAINTLNEFIYYTDPNASTPLTPYEYTINVVDACGNESGISNIGRTICLKGEAMEGYVNRLNWNPYADWSGGVLCYNLFTCEDSKKTNPVLLSNFDNTTINFNHDVADSISGKGVFCYYIEALEDEGNVYGFQEKSYSNVVCLLQEPEFYIASGFLIDGKSGPYGPKGIFIKQAKNYAFSIWTRWGERIFWTNVPGENWDGTYQGQKVQMGMYVYLVDYKSMSGKYITRSGRVMVVR